MPTLNKAVLALERHLDFPASRTRTVSRRLQDAGLIPLGSAGTPPRIEIEHFANLFLALAADTSLREAADAVRTYNAMTPEGADLTGAPRGLTEAGPHIQAMLHLADEGDHDVRRATIDVVSNYPEIAVSWPDGQVQRFMSAGALSKHWQTGKRRKSTTVTLGALADAVCATFGGARA